MPKTIACYIRLSQADDDLNQGTRELYESSSISHQRELIHAYLKEHPEFDGWNIREFVDDGYSGTSDKRPEFQRMIELARRGQIHCKGFFPLRPKLHHDGRLSGTDLSVPWNTVHIHQ